MNTDRTRLVRTLQSKPEERGDMMLKRMTRYSTAAPFSFLLCFLLEPAAASELSQSVALDGDYASEFVIGGDAWSASSGGQEVTLLLSGRDLVDVRQLELIIEPTPPSAFDLESAAFTPDDPLVTLGKGVELIDGDRLRLGGASVSDPIAGDQQFGTFTLRTSEGFTPSTGAQLEVTFLSLGPTSNDRDEYRQENLGLGVVVSVGDTETSTETSTWGRIKAVLMR